MLNRDIGDECDIHRFTKCKQKSHMIRITMGKNAIISWRISNKVNEFHSHPYIYCAKVSM